MYKRTIVFILLAFIHCRLFAQTPKDSAAGWSFFASAYYYFVPDDDNTLTLISTADHKNLHLEARYNYEDHKTGSAFAGWRLETGRKISFEFTPMLGFAFGRTNGFVPAMEISVNWRKFDYYAETEYVVDFSGSDNNFFYTWGELAFNATKNLRAGMAYQRTKLYQSDFEVQRGIFAGYSFKKLTAGIYYFNPFAESNFVILSVSFDF